MLIDLRHETFVMEALSLTTLAAWLSSFTNDYEIHDHYINIVKQSRSTDNMKKKITRCKVCLNIVFSRAPQ